MAMHLFERFSLSTGDSTHVNVQKEMSSLTQSFQSVQSSAAKKIDAASIDLTKLVHFLISLFPRNSIPNPVAEKMEAAPDTQSLFSILTRHGMWSYINYHLLKSFVDEYMPHDDEQQKQLKCYIAELEEFTGTTRIHEYIAECQVLTAAPKPRQESLVPVDTHSPDPELFSCLTTKVELTAQLDKISHVLALQGHMMKHFSLSRPTLLLGSIRCGSVVINWHFPMAEIKRISSTAASSSDFFKEHSILQVTVGDQVVYGDVMTATAQGQQEVGR